MKALILISPEKQIKGIGIDPTLIDPNIVRLPMMIVAGASSPEADEAQRIAKRVEAMKKRVGFGEAQGFELMMPKTKLSGPALINETANVIPAITDFVKSQVKIGEEENPWIERD